MPVLPVSYTEPVAPTAPAKPWGDVLGGWKTGNTPSGRAITTPAETAARLPGIEASFRARFPGLREVGFEVPEQIGAAFLGDAGYLDQLTKDAPPLREARASREATANAGCKRMDMTQRPLELQAPGGLLRQSQARQDRPKINLVVTSAFGLLHYCPAQG